MEQNNPKYLKMLKQTDRKRDPREKKSLALFLYF